MNASFIQAHLLLGKKNSVKVKRQKLVQFFATFLRFPAKCISFPPSKMADISTPKSPLFFFSFPPSTLSALFSRERAAGTNQTQHGGGRRGRRGRTTLLFFISYIYGEGGRARNCPRHPKNPPSSFFPHPWGKERERERERAFSWHPPPACWVG